MKYDFMFLYDDRYARLKQISRQISMYVSYTLCPI